VEVPKLLDETTLLMNEFTLTEQRLQNIRQEKTVLKQSNKEFREILDHISSL